MSDQISLEAVIPSEMGQKRLDQAAALLFPDFSRSRIQDWIKSGELQIDGKSGKTRDKVIGGETLTLNAELEDEGDWVPEDIPLDLVYEDDHLIVINKPRDLVVHPAAGNPSGTLLNGLLFHYPELIKLPRAGIVHRLDKDTTGLMVVARSLEAHTSLVEQLQSREMGREYEAVCSGVLTGGGVVDEPIGRHSTHRTKMAVHPMGKEAVTHYRVLHRFRHYTHIRLKLETGRTHQIRVHMAYLNHALLGDPLYAGRFKLPKGISLDFQEALKAFTRQALHAKRLELLHPVTDQEMAWEVDLPSDFTSLLAALSEDQKENPGEGF